MSTLNIHEAKTHFSRLVDEAASGSAVIIAKAGKPVAKLVALDAPAQHRRIGFLEGQFLVPDDFNTMGTAEIEALFTGA
jgi:prevent-host-death family protein